MYSLSIRSPHFKWIQDLSSYDKVFSITPGNNGRLYVTVPIKALLLALDVSSGNVLWEGSIGPLSTADHTPVVDTNGNFCFCMHFCPSFGVGHISQWTYMLFLLPYLL